MGSFAAVLSSRLLWSSHSVDVAGAVGTFERTEMTRVLIISEVRLYREGLVRLLRREQRLDVVGTACDVPEALEVLAGLPVPPEAVLLDVPPPPGPGGMRRPQPSPPAARIVAPNVSGAAAAARGA